MASFSFSFWIGSSCWTDISNDLLIFLSEIESLKWILSNESLLALGFETYKNQIDDFLRY